MNTNKLWTCAPNSLLLNHSESRTVCGTIVQAVWTFPFIFDNSAVIYHILNVGFRCKGCRTSHFLKHSSLLGLLHIRRELLMRPRRCVLAQASHIPTHASSTVISQLIQPYRLIRPLPRQLHSIPFHTLETCSLLLFLPSVFLDTASSGIVALLRHAYPAPMLSIQGFQRATALYNRESGDCVWFLSS